MARLQPHLTKSILIHTTLISIQIYLLQLVSIAADLCQIPPVSLVKYCTCKLTVWPAEDIFSGRGGGEGKQEKKGKLQVKGLIKVLSYRGLLIFH